MTPLLMRAVLVAAAGMVHVPAVVAATDGSPLQRTWQLDGRALKIVSPCAKRVTIEPGTGAIAVVATARNAEELDRLAAAGGAPATLGLAAGAKCHRRWPTWSPTLEIAIRAPAGLALEIHEDGSGSYSVAVPVGALVLDLRGSGGVDAGAATAVTAGSHGSGGVSIAEVAGAVTADASGSGTLHFGRIGGALTARASGSGDVQVDAIQAPVATVTASGSGDVRLGGGSVGALQVQASGSGDVIVGAVAGDATVRATGSGSVRVAKATGRISSDAHGSGSVSIGR